MKRITCLDVRDLRLRQGSIRKLVQPRERILFNLDHVKGQVEAWPWYIVYDELEPDA